MLKMLVGAAIGAAVLVGAAMSPAAAIVIPPTTGPQTFADINCDALTPGRFATFTVRAWGSDYPALEDVVVVEKIYFKGQPFNDGKVYALTAGKDGTWTTPTDSYWPGDRGVYEFKVQVTDAKDGHFIGFADDKCTI